jgi:predicted lipid-binding transport protein (Tim44 family)
MSTPKFESLAPAPKSFGDGWMTVQAQDMCKIAIAYAGFDPAEIVRTVAKLQGKRDAKANLATVEKALQIIYEAHETPELRKQREAARQSLNDALASALYDNMTAEIVEHARREFRGEAR